MEERQESRAEGDRTAPDPQHFLSRWCEVTLLQQNTDDLNNLELELSHYVDSPALLGLLLVLVLEGPTSALTGNRLESR